MSNHKHIGYLDSIRGVAAMIVVWNHYAESFPPSWYFAPLANSPLHLLWSGAAAVSVFFVLSGFVLSLRYFTPDGSSHLEGFRFTHYFAARTLRIAFPYFVVLAISIALRLTLGHSPSGDTFASEYFFQYRNASVTWASLRSDVDLMSIPGFFQEIPQGWTLSCELVFSLFVPAVALVAGRSAGFLLILLVVALRSFYLDAFAVHFVLGILIARAYKRGARFTPYLLVPTLFLLSFHNSVEPYARGLAGLAAQFGKYAGALGAAGLLVCALRSPGTQRVLMHPVLRFVGKVSYSLYLSHFLVLFWIAPPVLRALAACGISWKVNWIFGLLIVTATATALATLIYYLCEARAIAWSRYWSRRPDAQPVLKRAA